MTVATFVQPNFTAANAATYKARIDAAFAVFARIGAAFAPHAQSAPDMTVRVDAGFVFGASTLTEVAAQSTGAIVAPVGNPRIDRVVIDAATGAATVVTGVEAGSPSAPAIPVGKLPCARVMLTVGMATITNADITDERTGSVATSGGGAGEFPSGTRMAFNQSAAPTGWTKETNAAYNDAALRVVTGSAATGGADAFTATFAAGRSTGAYTLQVADIPVHQHTGTTASGGTHSHTGYTDSQGAHQHGTGTSVDGAVGVFLAAGVGAFVVGGASRSVTDVAGAHAHNVQTYDAGAHPHTFTTDGAGGGGGHSHSMPTLNVKYVDLIICQKN